MTFDTAFERSHKPNTPVGEKDGATANEILTNHREGLAIRNAITAALTTARKEAREAAFRDAFKVLCPDCAEGDEPMFSQQARWYYHREGNQEVGCSSSKLRIEAAKTEIGPESASQT